MDEYKYMGWSGRNDQVLHFLRIVGADRDDDGRFILTPVDAVVFFLGIVTETADVVVNPQARYYVDGKGYSLVAGLRGTSYGHAVQVIM